jgi:ligand-binding sensor domain-containing protein
MRGINGFLAGFALVMIISGLSVSSLFAQEIAQENMYFEHIDKSTGLSNMAVSSIVQDSQGFLWFGTQGGLNRYDGYEFKTYKKQPFDSNSLSHDLVQTLFMDSDDILWVGTYNGLNRFDLKTGEITRYENVPGDSSSLSDDVVVSILRDDDGRLWVGTSMG